jgi:hypothetical protein
MPSRLKHWLSDSCHRWTLVVVLIWLGAIVTLLRRVPYGTSNLDEAFYSAMPYSFLLGDRPYVDELGVFQNVGVLLMPFYRVYLAVAGSSDGIILFNRYLYVVYLVICSIAAYAFSKRIAGSVTAWCVAALVVTFSYFNLFAISYNTVGAFSFFCGVLCTASAFLKPRPGPTLFAASLLLLLAMYGYPGLTPVVAVYAVIVLAWLFRKTPREARRNALLGLGAGAVVALAVFSLLALRVGREGFARLLAFSRGMGYGTQGIFERLNCFHLVQVYWHWLILGFTGYFAALPLAVRFLRRAPWLVAILSCVTLVVLYWRALVVTSTPTGTTILLAALPTLAPICIALNRSWKWGAFVLQLVWAPSFVAMVTIAYTSSNQFQAASLESLGVTLAGVVSFAALLEALAERYPELRRGYGFVFGSFFLTFFAIQVHTLFNGAYSDVPELAKLTTRVHTGPQRGTYTTQAQADFLEQIDRDLKLAAQGPDAKTITILDNFPTGYLSTRLRPRTFTHWIIWGFLPAPYASAMAKETFGSPEKLADVLLEIHVEPKHRAYWERYMRRHYKPLIKRPALHYVIYKRVD